jgi:hypothetical protein
MVPFKLSREHLAAAERASPPHMVPIFEAVRVGCQLLLCPQKSGPFELPRRRERALIAIVGDDVDQAFGPAGFHVNSMKRLLRAASHGMIISSSAEVKLYAVAALAARLTGRISVVVETRPEQEIAWHALFQATAPRVPLIVSTVGGTA